MARCSTSITVANACDTKSFTGLRQLAESRHYKELWTVVDEGYQELGPNPSEERSAAYRESIKKDKRALHIIFQSVIDTVFERISQAKSAKEAWIILHKSYRGETRVKTAWFLDQFGVLHDGKQPYPGAISTLKNLAAGGAKMIIISNSSRRASTTLDKLKSLGFDPSLFAGAITSGELTYQYLQRRDDPWFQALGKACIHMTWSDRGAISLEGLGLQVVENVEQAEFILVHGTEALGLSSGDSVSKKLDELEKILEQCAAKGIPMVVANPDFVTVEARELRIMPGTLAASYEKLGGEVKWMGKPHQIIYKSAMIMAGVDASDSIAVGDSLHHDIKGANASGIESAFITCGIHSSELGLKEFGELADLSSVQALALKYDAYPSYVLPSFTW